jgi:hypothetical protein
MKAKVIKGNHKDPTPNKTRAKCIQPISTAGTAIIKMY